MEVTDEGIVSVPAIPVPRNAYCPMTSDPEAGRASAAMFAQLENAPCPMEVTDEGIVIVPAIAVPTNAFWPIVCKPEAGRASAAMLVQL